MFRFLNPLVKTRALFSKLGSLVLLFQRSPLVQILFPEARVLGGTGLGKIIQWTIATVAGMGAYDTVAEATQIVQLAPNLNSNTVPAANGSSLSFVFQLTNYPSTPGSWSVSGLPTGLNHTNAKNSSTDSISGTPTQSGTFTIKVTAHANTNFTGSSYSTSFTMNVGTQIISAQPTCTLIVSGGSSTLSVAGTGSGLSYQWYLGTSGEITNPVLAATSASFTTPGLTASSSFWVRVITVAGTADSNTAIVTVNDPLITWKNHQLSAQDFTDPLISGPAADPDGDGITNTAEYIFGLLPLVSGPSPAPVVSVASGEISMSFTAKAATGHGYSGITRYYAIEATDTLDSTSWSPVGGCSDILASGQLINYQAAATSLHLFYRLSV